MFTVKDREKPQSGLTSALKNRDTHAGSMQPTGQALDSLKVLQRNLGNSYLQGYLQTKLVVGSAGDVYEQEADRVADQVMQMPEPQIQRACPRCDKVETVQTKPLAESITPLVQRQVEPEGEEEEKEEEEEEEAPV